MGEQKKMQESQGEKVKKENNQTLLFVLCYTGNLEELKLMYTIGRDEAT